jgi:hypothetical protein
MHPVSSIQNPVSSTQHPMPQLIDTISEILELSGAAVERDRQSAAAGRDCTGVAAS